MGLPTGLPIRLLLRRHLTGLLLLAAGCAVGEKSSGRGLTYYEGADPASLDPALSNDVQSGEVVTLLFDNLVQFDPDGQLRPGIATRWESDRTGAVYTFHLRADATFHDGRPISARDVRASVRRVLDPASRGGRQWPLFPIKGAREFAAGKARDIAGIAVPDDTTIVFTLTEPLNIFPKFLAMPVAAVVPTPTPEHFDQAPIGSGPWRFVSWSHDDAIVLARNTRYWAGAPKEDTLTVRIIPEALTQGAEFETGNLSVVEIPFGETRRWEMARPEELQRRPALRDLYIAMNTTRGPLKDLRVRRALNLATDVATLLRTQMAGRGVRAAGAIPPGILGYDSTRAPYAWDTAAARRLLAEAGYPHGFTLQLWRSKRAELARVAQSVQQDLGLLGIRVEIVERDAPSVRATVRNGEADLFLGDWYADYPDPENFSYPLFHSANHGAGGNYAFLSDTALDHMIERARSTPDTLEKARLSREVDARVFELVPWIFLWFPADVWAVQPDVKGWRIPAVFTGQRWTTVERAR
ncbi:MAG TPA: ABC transporter substrate-binding protein [Gemmatimonadales bacterium]|nr:ABC transporter substrate-binding protein [Gemmatimonadales bacterium]